MQHPCQRPSALMLIWVSKRRMLAAAAVMQKRSPRWCRSWKKKYAACMTRLVARNAWPPLLDNKTPAGLAAFALNRVSLGTQIECKIRAILYLHMCCLLEHES